MTNRHQAPIEVGRPSNAQVMVLRALDDLVELASVQIRRAGYLDQQHVVVALESIAHTLDRAIGRLVADKDYIDAAEAFALAGLKQLAVWGKYIDHHMQEELEHARA